MQVKMEDVEVFSFVDFNIVSMCNAIRNDYEIFKSNNGGMRMFILGVFLLGYTY